MKKRMLLSSIMMIVLCISLISGATFALFTSESKTNIAISSGKVSVTGSVEDLKTYSMEVEQTAGQFENGGLASFDEESNLKLDLLTPGDKASFTVKIDNNSNVTIQYRIVLSIEGELAPGLVSKAVFNNEEYSLTSGATRWFTLAAGSDIPDVTVEIELPVDAGNEYQDKNAVVKVVVEAVQGNAETVDEWNGTADTSWYDESEDEFVLYTAEELAGFAALTNGATNARSVVSSSFKGKTIKLGANIDLKGINWTPIADPSSDGYVGFEGVFDGQGYTISNLVIDNTSAWGQGLFGYNVNKTTTIKNLTLNNVSINTEDTSGAVAGYFSFGTIENVNVTGNVEITGAQHMGGIVGNGYYTNISNCSVVANEGSYIKATAGSFVGGIVGYHGEGNYSILNSTVKNLELTAVGAIGVVAGFAGYNVTITGSVGENVVLNKTSVESNPSIGLVIGSYTTTSNLTTNISNNTFNNITLNGQYKAYPHNILIGSHYSGSTDEFAGTLENNTYENINNNLEVLVNKITVTSEAELLAALENITEETVIDATGVTFTFTNNVEYKIPAGVTLKGAAFASTYQGGNVVYTTAGPGEKVVFEDCVFDRNSRSYLMVIGSDGTCKEMEFNNCEFIGSFNLSFYDYDQGTATYNKCKFTAYDGKDGYIVCIAGNQYFNNCSFDYTNAKTGDMGVLKRNCINASGTDGRYCYVELNSCSLISTGTYKQSGTETIVKK